MAIDDRFRPFSYLPERSDSSNEELRTKHEERFCTFPHPLLPSTLGIMKSYKTALHRRVRSPYHVREPHTLNSPTHSREPTPLCSLFQMMEDSDPSNQERRTPLILCSKNSFSISPSIHPKPLRRSGAETAPYRPRCSKCYGLRHPLLPSTLGVMKSYKTALQRRVRSPHHARAPETLNSPTHSREPTPLCSPFPNDGAQRLLERRTKNQARRTVFPLSLLLLPIPYLL